MFHGLALKAARSFSMLFVLSTAAKTQCVSTVALSFKTNATLYFLSRGVDYDMII